MLPEVPPETTPVTGSITAPSVGATAKLYVPPIVTGEVTVPPSQVGIVVKATLSPAKTSTVTSIEFGQAPTVVYVTE